MERIQVFELFLFEDAANGRNGWYRTQTISRRRHAGHPDRRPEGRRPGGVRLKSVCPVRQHWNLFSFTRAHTLENANVHV